MKAPAPRPPDEGGKNVAAENVEDIPTFNAIVYQVDAKKQWSPLSADYLTLSFVACSNQDYTHQISIREKKDVILDYPLTSSTRVKIRDSFVRWQNEDGAYGARFSNEEGALKFYEQLNEILYTDNAVYAKVTKTKLKPGTSTMSLDIENEPPKPTSKTVVLDIEVKPSEVARFQSSEDSLVKDFLLTVCTTAAVNPINYTLVYSDNINILDLQVRVKELKSRKLKLIKIKELKKHSAAFSKAQNAKLKKKSNAGLGSLFGRSKSTPDGRPTSPESNDLKLDYNDPMWKLFLDLANIQETEILNTRVSTLIEQFVDSRGGYVYLRQVNDTKMSPQLADDLNSLAGQVHGLMSPEPASTQYIKHSVSTERIASTLERKKRKAPLPPVQTEKQTVIPSLNNIRKISPTGTPSGKRRAPSIPKTVPKSPSLSLSSTHSSRSGNVGSISSGDISIPTSPLQTDVFEETTKLESVEEVSQDDIQIIPSTNSLSDETLQQSKLVDKTGHKSSGHPNDSFTESERVIINNSDINSPSRPDSEVENYPVFDWVKSSRFHDTEEKLPPMFIAPPPPDEPPPDEISSPVGPLSPNHREDSLECDTIPKLGSSVQKPTALSMETNSESGSGVARSVNNHEIVSEKTSVHIEEIGETNVDYHPIIEDIQETLYPNKNVADNEQAEIPNETADSLPSEVILQQDDFPLAERGMSQESMKKNVLSDNAGSSKRKKNNKDVTDENSHTDSGLATTPGTDNEGERDDNSVPNVETNTLKKLIDEIQQMKGLDPVQQEFFQRQLQLFQQQLIMAAGHSSASSNSSTVESKPLPQNTKSVENQASSMRASSNSQSTSLVNPPVTSTSTSATATDSIPLSNSRISVEKTSVATVQTKFPELDSVSSINERSLPSCNKDTPAAAVNKDTPAADLEESGGSLADFSTVQLSSETDQKTDRRDVPETDKKHNAVERQIDVHTKSPTIGGKMSEEGSKWQTTDEKESISSATPNTAFSGDTVSVPVSSKIERSDSEGNDAITVRKSSISAPNVTKLPPSGLYAKLKAKTSTTKAPLVKKDSSDNSAKEPIVKKDSSGITTKEPIVKKDSSDISTKEPVVKKDSSGISTKEPIVKKYSSDILTKEPIVKKYSSDILTKEPIVKKDSSDISTKEPVVKKDSSGISTKEPIVKKYSSENSTNVPLVKTDSSDILTKVPSVKADSSEILAKDLPVKNVSPAVQGVSPFSSNTEKSEGNIEVSNEVETDNITKNNEKHSDQNDSASLSYNPNSPVIFPDETKKVKGNEEVFQNYKDILASARKKSFSKSYKEANLQMTRPITRASLPNDKHSLPSPPSEEPCSNSNISASNSLPAPTTGILGNGAVSPREQLIRNIAEYGSPSMHRKNNSTESIVKHSDIKAVMSNDVNNENGLKKSKVTVEKEYLSSVPAQPVNKEVFTAKKQPPRIKPKPQHQLSLNDADHINGTTRTHANENKNNTYIRSFSTSHVKKVPPQLLKKPVIKKKSVDSVLSEESNVKPSQLLMASHTLPRASQKNNILGVSEVEFRSSTPL